MSYKNPVDLMFCALLVYIHSLEGELIKRIFYMAEIRVVSTGLLYPLNSIHVFFVGCLSTMLTLAQKLFQAELNSILWMRLFDSFLRNIAHNWPSRPMEA